VGRQKDRANRHRSQPLDNEPERVSYGSALLIVPRVTRSQTSRWPAGDRLDRARDEVAAQNHVAVARVNWRAQGRGVIGTVAQIEQHGQFADAREPNKPLRLAAR